MPLLVKGIVDSNLRVFFEGTEGRSLFVFIREHCKTHCPWKLINRFSDFFCLLLDNAKFLVHKEVDNKFFKVKFCINYSMMTIFV